LANRYIKYNCLLDKWVICKEAFPYFRDIQATFLSDEVPTYQMKRELSIFLALLSSQSMAKWDIFPG